MTTDDAAVAARLLAIREELEAKVWPTAVEAAASSDHECIRDLVKLKVDLEAIDFARQPSMPSRSLAVAVWTSTHRDSQRKPDMIVRPRP